VARSYAQVLEVVKTWPAADQFALEHRITDASSGAHPITEAHGRLEDVLGLLATDAPAPDDEQIAQLLNERRLRKFG
jgi:hypothetical protein